MRTSAMLVVGAIVLGTSVSAGQDPGTSVTLTPGQQNDLVKQRCVVCHNDATPRGGLNLVRFDFAHPDPAVARLMAVKIEIDKAMAAAGPGGPDAATVAALLDSLKAAAHTASSPGWIVDLTADPLTPKSGHSLVVARFGGPAGTMTFSCNGANRRPSMLMAPGAASATPAAVGFEGLSPTIRQIFSWCLAAPEPTQVAAAGASVP